MSTFLPSLLVSLRMHQLTHAHRFLTSFMFLKGTSDVMDALMESSTLITDETCVYEDDQESRET